MKVKLSAFFSYCSLNVITSEVTPGPFPHLDNGSFFRDMEQFGLKRAIFGLRDRGWICRTAYPGSSLLPTFHLPKGSSEHNFLAYDLFWYLSHCLCALQSSPCPFPDDRMTSLWTEPSSGGKQMEHLQTDLYHPLPWNLLRTAAVLMCVSTKGQFTASEQQILWKYWNWGSNSEKNTDKAGKWKGEDREGWREWKAFKRFWRSFRNSSSVKSHWKNSPTNCFRKCLSKSIFKILITVFYLLILKKQLCLHINDWTL